jgi:ABC-type sugar transport system ATPase subunit
VREGPVVLGVRPHDLALHHGDNGAARAVVTLVEPLGSEQLVYVDVPDGEDLVAAVGSEATPRVDERVSLEVAPSAVHLFDAETGARVVLGG